MKVYKVEANVIDHSNEELQKVLQDSLSSESSIHITHQQTMKFKDSTEFFNFLTYKSLL